MVRYLDPKNDIVFKKIFGEHPHLLKSFLNAVLPLADDKKIESLEYLPTEHAPQIPCLKRPIVDVKCTDQQGNIFIVEMQLEWTDSFMKRLLYNTACAYVKQLNKGEHYAHLNPVYGLALINASFDPDPAVWYHHYGMIRVGHEAGKPIDGLTLVFVELPKFPVSNHKDKQLKILWLRFLREVSSSSTPPSSDLFAIPEIQEALQLAEESAFSDAELEVYNRYWDSIQTEKTLFYDKYNEGKAEGLAEGKQQALAGVAKALQAQGFTPLQIRQITGLPLEDG